VQRSISIDKIPFGIIVFNEFGKIISANSSGKEFTEKTKDCMFELITDIVSNTLHGHVPIEKIIKYSNINDYFVWRITTELVNYTSSEVIVIVYDETRTYQLEHTILKAEKLAIAGQLAIGSLVEIRNPLTSAKGFCQFIEGQNEIEQEYIQIILDGLQQIQGIVDNCISLVDNSQQSTLEVLYKKIWACVGSQIDSYQLIMVTDDFDNLTIDIAEDHVNNTLIRPIKILNIWLEENTQIIINVDLQEEEKYLNLNIRAFCNVKWDIHGPRNLDTMVELLEGKNNQIELLVINNNTIMIKLHLPIIVPPHFKPITKDLSKQVSLSK
jgi:signal transduction histidine kinase